MPRGNPTPVRSVRITDSLWERLQHIAATQGVSVTDVITDALTRYERRRR